jgi:transcriptional regulator with XRE-family HTH domain
MNKVREVRQSKGWSCEALARKANMTSTDLSRLERGLAQAFPAWRQRLAEALETAEGDLFPEEVPGE